MSNSEIVRVMELIENAQRLTREMSGRDPRAHLFRFADEQLRFMRGILEEGRFPTEDEKRNVSVGRMAIHEFESGTSMDDPWNVYADALETADGAFSSLGSEGD